MIRKLLLAALVIGICTPAIMAQETAKDGIYGSLLNMRFDAREANRQDAKQELSKIAAYGDLSNLHLNVPEADNQDVKSLPQAPKTTLFSSISHEMGQQYAISLPLNSRGAAGGAGGQGKCPPSCPSDDYNRFEIYGGYSLLSYDLRVFGIVTRTPLNLINNTNAFDLDRQVRFNLSGGEVAFTFNFTRYLGVQFDFSGHSRTIRRFDPAFVVRNSPIFGTLPVVASIPRPEFSVRNFLVGVQVKDNLKEGPRARPFGYLLLGASRQRLRLRDVTIFTDLNRDGVIESFIINNVNRDDDRFRRTSFALALGTGFDIRLTDRFSIRPIKFDYFPTFVRTPILIFNPPTLPLNPASRFTLVFADLDNDRKARNNFRIGAGVVFSF
jgi:opacity protein-like surface antigen